MRYPVLFVGTQQQIDHWMHERLLGRIGYKKDDFHYCAIEEGEEAYTRKLKGMKVVAPLGEEGLWSVMMEKQPLRWLMRAVPQPSRGLTITPLLAPSRLLPYRKRKDEDDEGQTLKFSGMERPARFQGVQQLAIRRAIEWSKQPIKVKAGKDYWQDPNPSLFGKWVDACLGDGTQLSFDIETPYKIKQDDESETGENELNQREDTKNIIRISFAYQAHSAVSIPWDARYLKDVQRLLGSKLEKIVWNGRTFDIPLLRANGMEVNGAVIDGMDMWHYYQSDLPKGLEFVSGFFTDLLPWKHINNSDPALYSCIDADAAYLIVQGLTTELKAREGQFENWRTHDQLCMAQLDIASKNGVTINKAKQHVLETELTAMLREQLMEAQSSVDDAWKKCKTYARPQMEKMHFTWCSAQGEKMVKVCAYCKKENVNKKHPCFKTQPQSILLSKREVDVWYKMLQPDAPLEVIQAWLKDNGFNPNSSKQLLQYMKGNGHPVAKNWKTDQDMADSKHMARLAVRFPEHEVYKKTVEIHKISKALSTYILATDANNKAYTTYVNSPSTWRLGSRNFNVQNQGKKGNQYASKARETIEAKPGHVFVQADSSAIEAVFTGVFMDDLNYIEIAKRSVHAYLCCKWLGWEFTKENAAKIKSDPQYERLYNQLKRVVHGTAYGMGPYLMHMNEPEIFPTMKAAKKCQEFLFQHLPKLPDWQFDVRQRAKREGYLENPWGLRHYFYDVFTYAYDDNGELLLGRDGKPKVKPGGDKQRVVAFLPQSSGGLFMRENIVALGQELDPLWFPAIHSVHDSYCLEVPDHDGTIEYAATVLMEVLTRKIPQMNNVRVGCEIEVGKDWKNMQKYCADMTLTGEW